MHIEARLEASSARAFVPARFLVAFGRDGSPLVCNFKHGRKSRVRSICYEGITTIVIRRGGQHELRTVKGLRPFYLDDYRALIEILLRGSSEHRVRVEADEYELDEPDEIKKLERKVVRELDMRFQKPFLNGSFTGSYPGVSIKGGTGSVHFLGPPDPQYGRALEALEFLKETF